MANTFINSNMNPLRFIDTSQINDSFDGDFSIRQILDYQDPKCYFQKIQRDHVLRLQILSDFVPTNMSIINVDTGISVASVIWTEVDTLIQNQTFLVYELEYFFNAIPNGRYCAEYSYTDENAVVHPLQSEGFDLQDEHPNTMLLTYKHSENNFDIVFETGIEFQFRVESAILDFDPKNDRNVYNDQKKNLTLLSSTPYRRFKFWVGYQYGLPPWVLDKVNWIQSVDQVQYNGIYYQVPEGSDFETDTNPRNSFVGSSIDIQPIDNNFDKYVLAPVDPINSFTPMQKSLLYYNVAASFPIAGYFKNQTILEYICVFKRSAPDASLKVGTTPGGVEIGDFLIDDPEWAQTIMHLFLNTSTLYLTLPLGVDCDITLVYKQLNEPPIDLGSGSGSAPPPLGIGAVVMYEEPFPGALELDFNTATGLGRANTDWFGWVFCDGRNGAGDWQGRGPIGQDVDVPEFSVLGDTGGEKDHLLTEPELPKFTPQFNLPIFRDRFNRGGTNDLFYTSNGVDHGTLAIDEIGGDVAHNNMQPYIITLFVKKVS